MDLDHNHAMLDAVVLHKGRGGRGGGTARGVGEGSAVKMALFRALG